MTNCRVPGSVFKVLMPGLLLLLTACNDESNPAAPGATTLTTSVSSLALAVTGAARTISITNTGTTTAISIAYAISPALPTGTTISSTCGDLAPAATCVLTVTPGATPSAAPDDTSPVPVVVTIAGTNTNTLNPSINILGFGSVYQSGYVFAIDDTTPGTGSISGKIAALMDQAAPFPSGIIWSSDSSGTVNFSSIYGIDETSTSSSPSPSSAQVSGQAACNGAQDGACNTQNNIVYYSPPTTSPAVNLSYYAAGLCASTIGGYSDWHLPAICEMGYDATSSGTGCGTSVSPVMQNMQSNLVENGNIGGLSGNYWSSTEWSAGPTTLAWMQSFAGGGGSLQISGNKSTQSGVRCARVITN